MSNDLIEKRNERTKQRKARKKRIDALIGLSANPEEKGIISLSSTVATVSDTNQTVRLIDEGYCDNGFVIKKGTLAKYLNGENEYVTGWEMVDGSWQRTEVLNLTDDFVGTVNLGHEDFATHPYILGEFKKSDLTLVDNENDRKGLDINVRLDEESMFIKELRRQPYDIGVSAEFYYHVDREATDKLEAEFGMWMPVIDEIFIFAYALVGECGNVGSSGLELKGESNMAEDTKNLAIEEEQTEEIMEESIEETEVTEVTEEVIEESAEEEAEEETAELSEEEPEEETIELSADEEETSEDEEAESEEAEEAFGDEAEGDEVDLEEALNAFNELREQVEQLTAEVERLTAENGTLAEANAELKKTNNRLSNKLKDEKKKKQAFIENAKSVSVKLGVNEEPKQKEKNIANEKFAFGDGIGD